MIAKPEPFEQSARYVEQSFVATRLADKLQADRQVIFTGQNGHIQRR